MKTARERMPLGLCASLGPPIPRENLLLRYVEPVYNCHHFKGTCTLHWQRNDVSSKLCSDQCEGYRAREHLEPVPPPGIQNGAQMQQTENPAIKKVQEAFAQQLSPFTTGGCCG